jgi:(E)-4-hydroxy-3-methylbut-2-enyl-diphosphate synthase
MSYCNDLFRYERRKTVSVQIGCTPLGGDYPIRIQSMTNTSTMDTAGSVSQCKRIIDAGADYVRLTAQGVREAENLACIRTALRESGYQTPLVADIHFNPRAADTAAATVEKVRINPGNYVDPVKTFTHFDYTDEEYALELQKVRDKFIPFIDRCKLNGTAIRIGVNHGSLSDRIMSRFGDTPVGMVESCLEFLRICVEESFADVAISIKASNPLVMVQTVRLLVDRMNNESIFFPLHLGVTEAGDGEDGRIKSAVGIGALLIDGIGDTIRVSLSEDPELEIPVANKLIELLEQRVSNDSSNVEEVSNVKPFDAFDPFTFHRRKSLAVGPFGGGQVPQVLYDGSAKHRISFQSLQPDFVYVGQRVNSEQAQTYPVFDLSDWEELSKSSASICFLRIKPSELTTHCIQKLRTRSNVVLLLASEGSNVVAAWRKAFHSLLTMDCSIPVVLWRHLERTNLEDTQLVLGMDFGPLLLDGFGDGLLFTMSSKQPSTEINPSQVVSMLYGVLQSTRLRISRTEYISCPSCGRTLFDLQQVIAQIKSRTSHLKGLKIGIMGCIVNGPGEMADADYGYVGSGRGQVSLYKGQSCVEKSIPADQALDKLITLIRSNGDWIDP